MDDVDDPLTAEELEEEQGVKARRRSKDPKTFECQYCGVVAQNGSELRKHVKEVHEETKTYQCTECNIKVSRKYHLIRHVKVKHSENILESCSGGAPEGEVLAV